jgi:D-amino peptidase
MEMEPWAPKAEAVVVKESITRFSARNLHPEQAREHIAAAAKAAIERTAGIPVPAVALPLRLEIDLQTADMAEVASWIKGVERSGTRQVAITGSDPLDAYRSFVGLTYITRVAEGR